MDDQRKQRWVVLHTPTNDGVISVALGPSGIRALSIGPDQESSLADLAKSVPCSQWQPPRPFTHRRHRFDQKTMEDAFMSKLVSAITKPPQDDADVFSLDPQGSVFEKQVWDAVRTIPWGQTISYKKLGHIMGKPQAARAIAKAVANNPIALLIPCHRVVHENGSAQGYRWGQELKDKLLAREQAQPGMDKQAWITLGQ